MRKGIVIVTSIATVVWLKDCVDSLVGVQYPILIVCNNGVESSGMPVKDGLKDGVAVVYTNRNGFELAGIEHGAEQFDEFVMLMDTCVVKDITLFDRLFAFPGSMSISPNFFHYMGKYVSRIVREVGVPRIETKEEAIQHELGWTGRYLALAAQHGIPWGTLEPALPVITDVFEWKNDRTNMVLETPFIIKYKARWQ